VARVVPAQAVVAEWAVVAVVAEWVARVVVAAQAVAMVVVAADANNTNRAFLSD
jgi:hypothetical protein